MVRPVAAAADQQPSPAPDPAPSRLGSFICVLALYLGFAGALIALGYGLWPALAGATTACVVACEVACRIITAGTATASGIPAPGSGLPELLRDVSRILDRGAPQRGSGDERRET